MIRTRTGALLSLLRLLFLPKAGDMLHLSHSLLSCLTHLLLSLLLSLFLSELEGVIRLL